VYLVDGGGWSEVERIVVIVCVVVSDDDCEVGIMMYVKDRDWVK
jgi:hypothetical protein